MKLLTNPIFLRMAIVFIAAGLAFVVGTLLMRRMRRNLLGESAFEAEVPASLASLPLHTYHAVIQQLKQQKHELQSQQQAERWRAKTSENISAAVLSNLSSGVLFFTSNGLVRQANAAAKQILGFASPLGMNAAEIFRDDLAESVNLAVRDNRRFHTLDARYITPAGEERTLDITLTSVNAPGGEQLGSACLVQDKTEIAKIRRQQELRGEMSAEMALELRTSLTTISGFAQQLAANRDPELARQLASDIAAEAAQLDRNIGGFLAGARAAKATA